MAASMAHFSLACISRCFETCTYVRTYDPSGYLTSATCIALLDMAPCQAITTLSIFNSELQSKGIKTVFDLPVFKVISVHGIP